MLQINETTWSRICPQCQQAVEHKNRNKCHGAERLQKICIKCSRSAIGKRNSELDSCPVCNEKFPIKHADKHALIHSMSAESLWLYKFNQTPVLCQCKCGKQTKWTGWKTGYSTFINGHASAIFQAFDLVKATDISNRRKASLRGKPGWAKGKTKDNDDRIAARAEASTIGIRKSFAEGREAWNKGQTKDTNTSVAQQSKTVKTMYESGELIPWSKGLTEETDNRIKEKNDDLRDGYSSGRIIPWHKGKTVKEDSRIEKFHANRDYQKEYEDIRFSNDEIEKMLENNISIRLEKIENYRHNKKPSLWMRCTTCNWFEKVSLLFAKNDRCHQCNPMGSTLQNNIASWIESLGFAVGKNVKLLGRQEIDILIPEKMVAIEVNGLFWHNEQAGKDENYHQSKSEKCTKIGINLVHIFEDEWYHKQDVIKSILKNKILNNDTRIFARKCKIIKLDKNQRKQFIESNHLDGDVQCSVAFGLKYNDQIVQVISCRKPQHKKYDGKLEIARSCSLLNTTVVGGLGKLMKEVTSYARENGYKSLITYADTRFGTGNSYEKVGFSYVKHTAPRFWWTDNHNRFNRFKFKADKNRNLSEEDVAIENNVTKIWGCKNKLFEMKIR